nr:hypothetical protein HmN_000399100 [Hymenolepis microstoma]
MSVLVLMSALLTSTGSLGDIAKEICEALALMMQTTERRTLFNTSDAFEIINKSANTSTDGLIPKYLNSKDELSSDTLLVLLSAITFKGIISDDDWHVTGIKQVILMEVDEGGARAADITGIELDFRIDW